ncbi:MAG: hypothetical protein JWP75_2328 [Frondihabitans sp.]|nr:hypothetical protein [Frondihabitans sp.]
MPNDAPTRRYAKGDAKRREILDAALTVISVHGYRNSSLQEIADAVGLTKAGVLHYFDTREHLLAEVLRERDEHDGEALMSADEDVIDLLRRAIDHNKGVPGLVQLYSRLAVESESSEHPGHDYVGARYTALRTGLEAALRARQERGAIRADIDPATFARVLIAVSDGLQLQWLHDPSIDMTAAVEAVLATLTP